MIEKIKLLNFKCFQQAEITMNRMTVLTGANASGKSTVIQSLILSDYTNRLGKHRGGSWEEVSIDINSVFGFPVGAPNALVSQNPVDDEEESDFVITLCMDGEEIRQSYEVDKTSPLALKVKADGQMTECRLQYLNAERVGPRVSNQAGKGDGITFDGENAAYLIEAADRTDRSVSELLRADRQASNKFSCFVECWMSAILGDLRLDIHTDYNKAITELRVKNGLVDDSVVPTLTGFGISYVLPIIVAGLWASTEMNPVLILENPEAHLHPYAQSNMGKFLALLAACGVQVIVETHSEHIIDGIRYQMAYVEKADQCIVHFMEHEGNSIRIKEIQVSPKGELSSWPKGFFDQKQNDLRDIFMLRKKDVKS
ncbi:MAG: DUF3696 domain-containing protein [Lachnospiraceae bacterium]|nr:DUF3696 domain-containing protein [Lachnospiraceae bacterium]